MRLSDWTAKVIADLKRQNFEAEDYQGFPLLRVPPETSIEERFRILEMKMTISCERRIFSEGVLFLPSGSGTPKR